MTVFQPFRRLVAALTELAESLRAVAISVDKSVHLQLELGPARDRLESLELSRAQFEAEMAGLVLKAEGKFKAANNAEARERALKKANERLVDGFDLESEDPEPPGDTVRGNDATPSEEERLQSLRLDVAPIDGKAYAIARKFGRV